MLLTAWLSGKARVLQTLAQETKPPVTGSNPAPSLFSFPLPIRCSIVKRPFSVLCDLTAFLSSHALADDSTDVRGLDS
jgi:hypothetical protein